jgi:hypothetical protein
MHKSFPLALVTTMLLLGGCSKSPESTVEDFYRAIEHGDYDKAKSLIASEQLLSDAGKVNLAFAMMNAAIKECGGIRSIDTTDLKKEGDYVVGTITLQFSGKCKQEKDKVKLKQQHGKWVLVDI